MPRRALFDLAFSSVLGMFLATDDTSTSHVLANSFLDAASLDRQEHSIVSSLLEGSKHRSLQTGNCMVDVAGGSPSCTANAVSITAVTGAVVDRTVDKMAQDPCNCDCAAYANPAATAPDTSCPACTAVGSPISCKFEGRYYEQGTVFGACLGDDDYVSIRITGETSSEIFLQFTCQYLT